MIHPNTRVKHFGKHRGSGIVATRFIPAGTLVWIPGTSDEILSYAQVSALSPERKAYLADYAYLTNAGTYMVSSDSARFVNHSCNANSLTIAGPEVSIAIRDIAINEELSEDYGLYYANGGFENCICGVNTVAGISPVLTSTGMARSGIKALPQHSATCVRSSKLCGAISALDCKKRCCSTSPTHSAFPPAKHFRFLPHNYEGRRSFCGRQHPQASIRGPLDSTAKPRCTADPRLNTTRAKRF